MDGATKPYMDVFTGVFWAIEPAKAASPNLKKANSELPNHRRRNRNIRILPTVP